MNRLLAILCTALMLATSCERYEDILDRINNLEHRVEELENQCRRLNSNVDAIQTVLSAVQQNDYVTEVMKIMEDGEVVGYSITFAKAGTITIYHGEDGAQGKTPQIGVRKASDGAYYWTADGDWLTDDEGNMIPASVSDPDGDYITPQFRVAEGIWYVSYDNGNSWREIGEIGKEGDHFFKDVQYDGEYICFTLLDDTKVLIPRINKVQNHWEGKKWYAYGTSLTSASHGKYVPYVADMSGLDVVNKGIGGGGIISNTKVKDAVMNTTDGKLEADLITLEVGANDASAPLGEPWDNTADTFLGSLTQCINYLLQNTNARIVVMSSPIGRYTTSGGSTEITPDNYKYLERWQGIRDVCIKCGVHYIGLADESGMGWARLNNNMGIDYNTDNIHHTDIGGYNLAVYMWSKLKDIPLWYTSVPDGDDEINDTEGWSIYDSFNRANTTSGLGTSDSGHIWKHYDNDGTKIYISDGKVFSSKDYPSSYCVFGTGNRSIQSDIYSDAAGQILLYSRYNENTGRDYVAVRCNKDGLTLLLKDNGTNKEIQSISASRLPSFPYTVKIDVIDDTHNVYVNDELMISHDITNLSDNANVGFSINGSESYIDNFKAGANVTKLEKKSISILFVGNSLTQDGIAYLPYMLKNYYPEVDFRFYMWYIGGYTLEQQYDVFSSNGKANIFSVAENSQSWTNYNKSKTMASVLSTYKFDIVCMQEYFKLEKEDFITDWNDCYDYIKSNYTGGNDLEFISLFHAPMRGSSYDVDQIYKRTEDGNTLILQTTDTKDMIPNGIAVYRALQTDLNTLGDKQQLSPDGVHTQEGLPCLLQTYVTLCWLFDRLGIDKSIYGHPMRMTTEIYKKISVPGANLGSGVITGTDEQNLLAQEIAINAYNEGKEFVKTQYN